jgi:23S rRNA (uracil1939-C5)-methyltransferase
MNCIQIGEDRKKYYLCDLFFVVLVCFVVDPVFVTLDIEKPAAGGRMLARHNGQVVLVWGAIPGERVRARVERAGKGVLYAETVDVVSPSVDRRDAAADWRCGGNVLAHVSYPRQLQLKSEIIRDGFARIGRMPLTNTPEVLGSPERGYRLRARLHVRNGRIGFMREGSHDLCAVGPTGQMLPETVAWIEATEERLRRDRVTGLASIEMAENVSASDRACHFELEPGTNPSRFAALAGDGLTGLSAQVLDRRGVEILSGVPVVSDVLHITPDDPATALRLRRDARAFFQGNRFLLEPLVRRVMMLVPPGPVVDLYAGVGLFGLSLVVAGAAAVTLVEGDAISGQDLQANAEPFAGRARVERSSVEEFLRPPPRLRHFGEAGREKPIADATFIVDPPRTGISKEAIAGIIRHAPTRIVYVSCDVATLARDARTLVDAGYSLDEVSGIDLFPNTAHVETVAVFTGAGVTADRPG